MQPTRHDRAVRQSPSGEQPDLVIFVTNVPGLHLSSTETTASTASEHARWYGSGAQFSQATEV